LYADPVAGIIVSFIVIKVGYDLAKESSEVMLEKVLGKEDTKGFTYTVLKVPGVERIDEILARTHGSYVIVDIKLSVDPYITVEKGHDIAVDVRNTLLETHHEIEDVLVHINPYH
ncbi:MAG TPA: cation diffusion facilitator family transporter, partial [Bacillota bacterium]|nr:cation diffusion facilitator family transporter [Bacillota bacterium]